MLFIEEIDNWHDWWRLGIFVISSICLIVLGFAFYKGRKTWDETKRDLWFVLVMWTLAAWSMQLEGLYNDSPLRGRLAFITAAGLVTLKLLFRHNLWGDDED